MFMTLLWDYQWCLSAHNRINAPNYDENMEEFRYRMETHWMNVRGKRYEAHERQALLDVLEPHSEILHELFGLDSGMMVNEIDKIRNRHATGLSEAMNEIYCLYEDVMEATP